MTEHSEAMVRAATAARTSYGRLLALLAASTSDIAAAEDALADAFERALRTWPERGVPDNPDAWLLTVARNRLRDHWKSAATNRSTELDPAQHSPTHLDDIDVDAITDKRLELMLVCAHPAIGEADRTPLMLNTVLGFTAEQIGAIFHLPTSTMATRLVRAKKRIKANRIRFELPDRSDLPARMEAVLEAVYGTYVIEWSTGDQQRATSGEALQLVEVLAELVPDDPEVRGLAALVELSAARRDARRDSTGAFVPLAHQDPTRWDQELIERAHQHLRAAHRHRRAGRFQLEAAVQAVHCARGESGRTDWVSLGELYAALNELAPTLGSRTAYAAVLGETDGPQAGLRTLDEIGERARRFQPWWVTRAHLLARAGLVQGADEAYAKAIDLTHEPAERQYLIKQRSMLAFFDCSSES